MAMKKNRILRPITLLGISLMMALGVSAQEPKVKVSDKEYKYKSEDLKIKEKKEETKYKSEDLKMKDEKDERKLKAKVKPMKATMKERTEVKTGATQVMTKEHMQSITSKPEIAEPVVTDPVATPKVATTVKKAPAGKQKASKSTAQKRTAARKSGKTPKYVVRTKIVRDTVYVPSPPERIVSTQTEYVRDTVIITRVDTVLKVQTTNTYTGYRVPSGDFKKVKLKRDKDDGEVWMKRKEKDGKIKTEKLEKD
jgi:hypothetical protein